MAEQIDLRLICLSKFMLIKAASCTIAAVKLFPSRATARSALRDDFRCESCPVFTQKPGID
jgi:hypothetical protein